MMNETKLAQTAPINSNANFKSAAVVFNEYIFIEEKDNYL